MVKYVVKWVRRMTIGIIDKHLRSADPYMPGWKEQILATQKMAKARNDLGSGQSREKSKK